MQSVQDGKVNAATAGTSFSRDTYPLLTKDQFILKRSNSSVLARDLPEDTVPLTDTGVQQAQPISNMSSADRSSFLLLIILYMLQGVPVGLTFGSIPFLLKSTMSYSQIAIFSLASYPYSLKLLWSPIVDSVYFKSIGRRKSWIIPIQLATGILFWWLGDNADSFMSATTDIYYITGLFLIAIFLSATQDIAVDGWALTLLSKDSLTYASTSQTVGINTGYFMSFTVFLALNSAEFCNKYLRSIPAENGLLPLGGYLKFWAGMYLMVTVWLVFFKNEVVLAL